MSEIQAIHECLFCPQTFNTAAAKDDHVLEHFAQETCVECNRNLIRIGGSLYVKHDASVCSIREPNDEKSVKLTYTTSFVSSQDNDGQCVSNSNIAYESIKTEQQNMMEVLNESIDFDLLDELDNQLASSTDAKNVEQLATSDIEFSLQEFLGKKQIKTEVDLLQQNDAVWLNECSADLLEIRCDICGKLLSSRRNLSRHKILVHSSPDAIFCDICARRFSTIEDRDTHRAECALKRKLRCKKKSNPDLRCDSCDKPFKSDAIYRQHMHRIHKQRVIRISCVRCHATFLRESWLHEHRCTEKHSAQQINIDSSIEYPSTEKSTETNQERRFVCRNCGQNFKFKQSLQRHHFRKHTTGNRINGDEFSVVHIGNPPEQDEMTQNMTENLSRRSKGLGEIQCALCPTKFQTNGNLYRHMRIKHNSTMYNCGICKNEFESKKCLFKHIRVKHHLDTDVRIPCEVCGEILTRNALKHHRLMFHSPNGTLFCRTCLKIFPNAEDLDAHRAECITKVTIKYECDLCKKVYANKFDLRRHMRTKHDPNVDKFKCKTCSKIFIQEISLRNHECKGKVINPSVRELIPCETCGKIVSRGAMRTHRIGFHSAPGTIFCRSCYKIFSNADDLKLHSKQCKMKIKCEMKSPCHLCKRILSNPRALSRHKVSLHSAPGTIFCRTCVKKFKTAEELTAHKPECTLKRKFQKQNQLTST